MNFRMRFTISHFYKNCHWEFDRDWIQSVDHFGYYQSYHIFQFMQKQCLLSVIFPIQYKSFTSLVIFFPNHFILSHIIVNKIIFLIFLSDCSLLVYSSSADLCVNFVSWNFVEFIISNRVFFFFASSLGIPTCKIKLSMKRYFYFLKMVFLKTKFKIIWILHSLPSLT